MLRYLLWVAALLSPRPASLLVLNEPETSLHSDLLPSAAELLEMSLSLDDASFASLSHEDLLRWLEGRPVVARGLLTQLAGRLRKANDVVADLVFSDVPGRVAKALLDLADRFGRTADDGVHVHHDLPQEELAQLVGASRETVNKALADFASRGWLRLEPRSVVIMDIDRLRRRAR